MKFKVFKEKLDIPEQDYNDLIESYTMDGCGREEIIDDLNSAEILETSKGIIVIWDTGSVDYFTHVTTKKLILKG